MFKVNDQEFATQHMEIPIANSNSEGIELGGMYSPIRNHRFANATLTFIGNLRAEGMHGKNCNLNLIRFLVLQF